MVPHGHDTGGPPGRELRDDEHGIEGVADVDGPEKARGLLEKGHE
jgi:hypothetical protein